jgi:hypothetical protein
VAWGNNPPTQPFTPGIPNIEPFDAASTTRAARDALREIATERRVTTATIVSSIDSDRQHNNLSSAIRLFVLAHYRALAERRSRPPG